MRAPPNPAFTGLEEFGSRFSLYRIQRCFGDARRIKQFLRLLLSFDIFKGAIAFIFLLFFLMLQAFRSLSGLSVSVIVLACVMFTFHIWIINTCINPIFRNPNDYIYAKKFASIKTFFSMLLLLLSLISIGLQQAKGDLSHAYVEAVFLFVAAYEIFGSYAIYSYYLHIKRLVVRSYGPARGVEQTVDTAFYQVNAVPKHAVGTRFIETIDIGLDGLDLESEKKDVPTGKQPRETSILDVYKRSPAHVLSPDVIPYTGVRGGEFGIGDL